MTSEADRERLVALAAQRLGRSMIVTDDEVGALATVLETRLPAAQRPLGGWYPADVLRALDDIGRYQDRDRA